MNQTRARRLYQSGNTILDNKGNVWNVLQVESNIKGSHFWYQLMQLRDGNGHRKYTNLIEGDPGQTIRSAQRKLIKKYYDDQFKLVNYDAINNEILKVIE